MSVITLKRSKKDELTHLEHIEEAAFAVNSRYFENGVLPPFSEEERTACTLAALFERDDAAVFSIYADNERVGGAVVQSLTHDEREIVLFFLAPSCQGKGVGQRALNALEAEFPETKVWRLITPTQVLRNAVFYVNKCGYHIVQIDAYDKEKESGMFIFEKRKEIG